MGYPVGDDRGINIIKGLDISVQRGVVGLLFLIRNLLGISLINSRSALSQMPSLKWVIGNRGMCIVYGMAGSVWLLCGISRVWEMVCMCVLN